MTKVDSEFRCSLSHIEGGIYLENPYINSIDAKNILAKAIENVKLAFTAPQFAMASVAA